MNRILSKRFFMSVGRGVVLGIFLFVMLGGMGFAQEVRENGQKNGSVVPWEKPEKPGKWYRMDAGYYVIWYEEKDKAVALDLARMGDAMYEDYADFFGDYNPKKVYIQIQSRTGYANGSYTPTPPIINFYTTAMPVDTKGYDWNYFLLSHEFQHYMQIEYRRGLSGIGAILFGPYGRLIPAFGTPGWVYEGFATKTEGDYTSGGRLYNPIFTMPYRADVLLNNIDTYLEMTRQFDDDETTNYARRYQYGVQLTSYLVDTYGYETTAKIWQRFMKFPIGYRSRIENQISDTEVVRVKFKDIYNAMITKSQKKYEAFKSWDRGVELQRLQNNRAVYSVIGSSDKGVLIHQSGTDVVGQYMLYTPKNQKLKKLFVMDLPAIDFYKNQPADITSDGSAVVYVNRIPNIDMLDTDGNPVGAYNDLFIYDTQKKRHKRLTKKQQLTTPVISDDKQYVYASQYIGSGGESRLIRISTKNPKQGYEIIYQGRKSLVFYKSLSPDGKRIVFVEKSSDFGIKLQLLEIATGTITTLLERAYGIWIGNPEFIDNNRISIVADLEYSTENSMMYEIDITDLENENIIWKRIGRDKVGFHSAVLSKNETLVYSSHNSKGYSIYHYTKSQLENEIIALDTIPFPSYYEENNIQRKLNKRVLEGKETVKERRLPQTKEDFQYKEHRALSAIPYRIVSYYPTILADTATGIVMGIGMSSTGPTQRAKFTSAAGYFIDSKTGIYNISYQYSFPRLGTVLLGTAKTFSGTILDEIRAYTQTKYIQSVQYKRLLLYTKSHFYMGINTSAALIHTTYTSTGSARLIFSGGGFQTLYVAALPIGWTRQGSQNYKLSNDFKWRISPIVRFIPQVLDQKEKVEIIAVDSSLSIPIVRRLGIKFSNNTAWANDGRYNLSSERFYQISQTSTLYYPNAKSSEITQTKIGVQTPIKSSFAFDILMPLANVRAGGYVFNPHKFFINLFAEQTVGYNIDYADKIEMNKYLISGIETGLDIGIFAISITINYGFAYRIPYTSEVSSASYMYFSIAPNVAATNGAEIY